MQKIYKPKDFASMIGKSVNTLQRWDREGTLKALRTSTDRRYYTFDQYQQYLGLKVNIQKRNIVYYRVSSSSQKKDLLSQKESLEKFCMVNGWTIDDWLNDIGSPSCDCSA